MSELTLEKIKIRDLKEYSNNAKEHPAEQISKIRDSIISFGYNDPIAIDENNEIIEGHGRLLALKQMNASGDKEIQVIKITGLSEDQKKAYRIAHNKLNLDTGFDLGKLGKEFNLLEDTDFFGDTGFSTKEISELWDNKEDSNTETIEHEKVSLIEHTCPECDFSWKEEIIKSKKRGD